MLSYMIDDSNVGVIKRVMTALMQLYMMAFAVSPIQWLSVMFQHSVSMCSEGHISCLVRQEVARDPARLLCTAFDNSMSSLFARAKLAWVLRQHLTVT